MKNPILVDLQMPIVTENLIISPPKTGDGVIFFKAVEESYPTFEDAMPWTKIIRNEDDAEEFVRESEANWILKKDIEPYLPLFIYRKDNMLLLGIIGFHHVNWHVPSLEIGYWLRRSQRGKGIMVEAVNALTVYAFKEINVKRIEIRCDILNIKSKAIPEKLGYQMEAVLKNHRISSYTSKLSDTLIYSRTDLEDLPLLDVNWK